MRVFLFIIALASLTVAWSFGALGPLEGSYALFTDTEETTATFTAATEGLVIASMDLKPEAFNPKDEGVVKATVLLPLPYMAAAIVPGTVQLGLDGSFVGPVRTELEGNIFKAFFAREAVSGLLGGRTGDVTFTLRGQVRGYIFLAGTIPFSGTDTIRVLDAR